jgi:hypothetical protein
MVVMHKQQIRNSSLWEKSIFLYRFIPHTPFPLPLYISYCHLLPSLLLYSFVFLFMFHHIVIPFPSLSSLSFTANH